MKKIQALFSQNAYIHVGHKLGKTILLTPTEWQDLETVENSGIQEIFQSIKND